MNELNKYRIDVTIEDTLLRCEQQFPGDVGFVKSIIDTKEAALREGLIKMGWVPPEMSSGSFEGLVWYEDGEVSKDGMSYMTLVNGLEYLILDDLFEEALSYFTEEGILDFEPPRSGCVTFKATNIHYDKGQMTFPETGQWDYCPHWEMDIEVLEVEKFPEEDKNE